MNKKAFVFGVIAAVSLASSTALADGPSHWGYTGHDGAEHWGDLDPSYALCSKGKNQSPVDIVNVTEADLPPLTLAYANKATEILNNGHTVQANFAAGNTLTLSGHVYELKQVHFHTPSENRIGGKEFALEAHFVHADPQGALAVVGVMLEEGAANPALAKLWAEMPVAAGETHPLAAAFTAPDLLPASLDYYRFNGSLTTPPCSEGVTWMVLKTPLTVSKDQIEAFSKAVHGHNNRPVQAINARVILK